MKGTLSPLTAPLLAVLLCSIAAHAQTEPQQAAQARSRMQQELDLMREGSLFGNEPPETQHKELEAFFHRLSGRFRIDGQITQGGGLSGQITGVADCAPVGDGLGIHCIIGATWPVIDRRVAEIGDRESPSEMLKTFNPAVLVLGLDPDQIRIRALLVTADSFSHGWVGNLTEHTMQARRIGACRERDFRCYRRIEITAGPQDDVVTLLLPAAVGINLVFNLHRDQHARSSQKQKSLESR